MLEKATHVFARHAGLDLECDVYNDPAFPPSSPVFLFFHSGGLVGGSKEQVPPWLVQVRAPTRRSSSVGLLLLLALLLTSSA